VSTPAKLSERGTDRPRVLAGSEDPLFKDRPWGQGRPWRAVPDATQKRECSTDPWFPREAFKHPARRGPPG